MVTNRLRLALLSLAMPLLFLACGSENKSNSQSEGAVDGNSKTENVGDGEEDGQALGNAQDESMPNTMVLAAEAGTRTTYSGKIDGKIEASMELFQTFDVIRGTITYKKGGNPILVLGTEGENGNLFLREYLPDGKITGVLSGKRNGDKFSGNWYGNGKDLKLAMNVTEAISEEEWPYDVKGSVTGEYSYHFPAEDTGDPGAAGTLKVKQSGNKIIFSFDCVNGPPAYNMAIVEEMEADLVENTAEVTLSDFDCQFTIQFFKGFAVVSHPDGHYDCGFGNGAGIEGEYPKVR